MRSIGLKLWAGMMVLVFVVIILLWLFQIVFLENFYTGMRVSAIKGAAYELLENYEENNMDINVDIKEKLAAFSYNNNLSIELLDTEGNTIFAGSEDVGGHMMMLNHIRAEAFYEVLENKEVEVDLLHPRFGNRFKFIGLPVTNCGQVERVFFINLPMVPVEETAAILKKQLLFITAMLFAAALLLSYVIARTFTRPVLQIKQAAEKMAAGDYSYKIQTKSKDEIGQLAQTINYMGQELSRIEQLRKDFIANVSHELRTPLSLIRGYAETIRDVSGNNPQKRVEHADIISEEAERLGMIVDDMLDLSQLQAGYGRLFVRTFSVNQLIERVMKKYDVLSRQTGIQINSQLLGDYLVNADEAKIEQVLYNLVNNAFNYTGFGGEICIQAIDSGNLVRVAIKDNGSGIPDEDLKHIWDRYYKSSDVGVGQKVGTGLGLAIVKNILEAHDARYGVASKINEGTTFWFEIKKTDNQDKQ